MKTIQTKEVIKTTDSITIEKELSCEGCVLRPEECERNLEARKLWISKGLKEEDGCPFRPQTSLLTELSHGEMTGISEKELLDRLTKKEMKLCEDNHLVKYKRWIGSDRIISNRDISKARKRLEELHKKSYPNMIVYTDYKRRFGIIFFTNVLTEEEAFTLVNKLDVLVS